MTPKQAIKALEKLKWTPGEPFKKRSPEDRKAISAATQILARAGVTFEPSKEDTTNA